MRIVTARAVPVIQPSCQLPHETHVSMTSKGAAASLSTAGLAASPVVAGASASSASESLLLDSPLSSSDTDSSEISMVMGG